MIFDALANWQHYLPKFPAKFMQAVEFLRSLPPDAADGSHVLTEKWIWANVQTYTPEPADQRFVEYHRDYVDLQTLLTGEEAIWYAPVDGLAERTPYDAAKDCGFCHFAPEGAVRLPLRPGNFAIFFPGEGHMPCVAESADPEPVRKVVLKMHRSIFGL